MKTKSSLKDRFRVTVNGKIMSTQAGKRHNLRKRSTRSLKVQTGMVAMTGGSALVVRKYFGK